MNTQDAARVVYDHLSGFESMSLEGQKPRIEIEAQIKGRWYEIEVEVLGCCDITAELRAQDADDRRYEDDQDVGDYVRNGPDVLTWADIARSES